ncbi:beta-defensin 38 precursor [Mus musculus]|uniref:Beta-defensin 38 n=2 Tax=Mus musculus TaxID=10090 RepID=DFB38_MOUSE|nr:beta-defensin 38 precursor [Mus musculus]Q7TNV7.1 RecName: Full=Beta-defensin 38; Short=BD-38; Short=mBD-38; AltName: Full=Defensin, beta 38; Flags: Precursor [Mus musculus]AAI25389.1 Defensin beta 38 [Mus musculus]AAI25391.1 Defensin beta 38 [Mus musculus]EDL22225.1 defensin beta 38 [Mus musculus]CAE01397.1 beta defensin 38 [Mus musculus]CAE17668.1 beta defensin 38 [Mus musculus]|eukprot:NP_898857.1 beta-defensin 38 precursor [Mus musculus]
MKISCFLLLILSLYFFQINQAIGPDTKKCVQRKNACHYFECPWLYYSVGTCYKGKGKCCQKRY